MFTEEWIRWNSIFLRTNFCLDDWKFQFCLSWKTSAQISLRCAPCFKILNFCDRIFEDFIRLPILGFQFRLTESIHQLRVSSHPRQPGTPCGSHTCDPHQKWRAWESQEAPWKNKPCTDTFTLTSKNYRITLIFGNSVRFFFSEWKSVCFYESGAKWKLFSRSQKINFKMLVTQSIFGFKRWNFLRDCLWTRWFSRTNIQQLLKT